MSLHRDTNVGSIEYAQRADEPAEPRIATQCSVHLHTTRGAIEGQSKGEAARYSGSDENAPSMGEMNKSIKEKAIMRTLEVHTNPTREAVEGRSKRRRVPVAQGRQGPAERVSRVTAVRKSALCHTGSSNDLRSMEVARYTRSQKTASRKEDMWQADWQPALTTYCDHAHLYAIQTQAVP